MRIKKILGSTLATAMIFAYGPADAELLKGLKFGGQIDLQATSADNVTDFATRASIPLNTVFSNNDRIGDVQTRIMLNMDWDLLDDVHSKVSVAKNDRTWGTAGGNPQGLAPAQPLIGGGGTGVANNIFLTQANFKIDKIGGQVDATFGRQYFGDSGDMIIYFGPSDKALYGQPVTAIDAARGDWSNDKVGLTTLVGKVAGHKVGPIIPSITAGAINVGDIDVRGITALLKGQDNVSASVYAWNQLTHADGALGSSPTAVGGVGGKNDNLYIVGVKGKWTSGGRWVSGEIAKNFGENRVPDTATLVGSARYTGWGGKVSVGDKRDVSEVGAVTSWGEFAYGTGRKRSGDNVNGNFTAISPDYRPGGIYGRFSTNSAAPLGGAVPGIGAPGIASNSVGNSVILGFGAKLNPISRPKLTEGVALWDYRLQTITTAPNAATGFNGNRHLGTEIDIDLAWRHSDNVTLMAGVGDFMPGGLIKAANSLPGAAGNAGETNPARLGYFDVRVKF